MGKATATDQDKPLLLRFHSTGAHLAAKRDTLRECARLMGVTETRAAHIAINQLWLQLTGREAADFDFPANLPGPRPNQVQHAATKQALDAFFAQTLPNG